MKKMAPSNSTLHRKQMIDAAAEILRRRGLQSVTVADVVGAALLNHSHFFAEFSNSEELYSAAVDLLLQQELSSLLKRHEVAVTIELITRQYLGATQVLRGAYLTGFAVEVASESPGSSMQRIYEQAILDVLKSISDEAQFEGLPDQHVILAALLGARLLADALPASPLSDAVRQSVMRWVDFSEAAYRR